MATPNIVDTKPTVLELEAGTYFWCSCGQSKNQPFCDGGHKGTEFVPEKVVLEEPQKVAPVQALEKWGILRRQPRQTVIPAITQARTIDCYASLARESRTKRQRSCTAGSLISY